MPNPIDEMLKGLDAPKDQSAQSAPAESNQISASNPIDAMLRHMDGQDQPSQRPADFSARPVAASPVGPSSNPIDSMLKQFDSGTTVPAPAIIAATPRMPEAPNPLTANPIDAMLRGFDARSTSALSPEELRQSNRPDPENQVEEPWYGSVWEWLNKPLYDAHRWGVREGAGTVERGIESGVEDLISGLTSPLSIALTIGTLGGGATLGAATTGLRALGVAAEDAPIVARGVKVLMEADFTAQAVNGLATQSPQFLDALKFGDYETAARLATNITAVGALTAFGGKRTFEDARAIQDFVNRRTPATKETLATAKKIAGQLDEDRVVASQKARELADSLRGQLTDTNSLDEISQGAIRKYMLAGGDLNLLRNQHDVLAGTLTPRQETLPETVLRQKGVELKKWLGNSKFVDDNGAPLTLYVTDSAEGTNKLGPTLTTAAGDAEDGHFLNMKRVKDFGEFKNLKNFIEDQGGEEKAKDFLKTGGFEGILYKAEDGKPAVIALDEKHVRPAEELKPAAEKLWNKDYLYHATDAANADMIRNAGVKGPKQKVALYADSPEQALNSAVTPVSGNRADLRVFAVPRTEVEEAIAKTGFKPKKTETNQKLTTTNQTHMPSHEVVLDENGNPTGQVVPLRVDSTVDPYGLTLDRSRFVSEYTPAEKEKLLAIYKRAQNLSEGQISIAKILRDHYEDQFNKAAGEGMIRSAIENYHPQAWANDRPSVLESLFGLKHEPTDNIAYNQLRHQTDNGAFDVNIAAAKKRAFETEFQGEMAGYKAKSSDLAYHAADYQMKLDRAIAARSFLERLRASGARAADGRPLAALSGTSQIVGEESGNPALLVNPNGVKTIQISNDIVKAMQEQIDPQTGVSRLKTLIDNGTIEKLRWTREVTNEETGQAERIPVFGWSAHGYQSIDHPSMRDWRYLGQDTAGNNAIMKAEMRVHSEAAEYVRQVVGADVSKFRTKPYLRALMAAQREAKGALLSFSSFHAAQEMLRGAMLGINPFDWKPVDVAGDPLLQLGVRNSLTFPDYRAQDMFSDGVASHSKIIGKIPGLNKIQDYIQEFTFNKLIPSLKARGFKSVYARFSETMPGSSADEIAHAAATYVNDAFGGQNWRALGISASGQDVMRATALAPDWLTSEIRMLWRAAGGMGKPAASIARTDMMRLAAGMYVTARVVNMLSSGSTHPEAPFGLVVPGQKGEADKVYSMRTLPTDLIHAITSPREFAMGRVNPLIVRTAFEGLTGRDQFGRKVTGQQEFSDFYHNFIPIGAQSLMKGSADLTNKDQGYKALGGTVYKYRTEAERLAQEKASDRMPSGPVDPSQLEAHQRNIRLEDGLRNGEVTKGEIRRMLPEREANLVISQSSMTPLQSRFQRLPLSDAIDVWNLSMPRERDDLHKLLWQKRVAYIQSHNSRERQGDPTWLKLQKTMGDLYGR